MSSPPTSMWSPATGSRTLRSSTVLHSIVDRFKGTGWEECNEFILAIRTAAWKEGKLRDRAWMADVASLHFSHQALLWHSQLPEDVREDWAKLEVALLNRWTPPKFGDEPPTEPTPAAAPSLNRSDNADRPLQGVLKLVVDGTDTSHYIELDSLIGTSTVEANRALRIRCNTLSSSTLLERIDGSHHSWLAVQWHEANPNLSNGSSTYGYLVVVDSSDLKTSWATPHPYQLALCAVSTDREVIPVLGNEKTRKIPIHAFCIGLALYMVVDPAAFSKMNPRAKRAKIFIAPIE